jgi:hypothetical protein
MSPFWSGVLSVLCLATFAWAAMCASSALRYRNEAREALAGMGRLLTEFKTETIEPLEAELRQIRAIAESDNVTPHRRPT